jgi:tetratricopeptide (TPR) repeat protein
MAGETIKPSKNAKSAPAVRRVPAYTSFILPALLVSVILVSYWLKIRPSANLMAVFGVESAEALLARGMQAHNAGSLDAALELYRKVLERDSANAFAHYNIAQIYNDKGRSAEAQVEYQAALQARPDFLDARLNLGVALYRQRKFPAAAEIFREVLKTSPRHALALFDLGITLIELGQLDQAIQWLNKSLSEDPKQAPAHYYLGVALARAGQRAKARAALEQAVALNPRHAPAYFELAKIYRAEGEPGRAREAEAKAGALAGRPQR